MEQNDLAEAAELFNMFKGARDYFKTTDKRCKIVDIDAFYQGAHWSIERWWTREERVELGIEKETESMSPEEMGSFVGDIANTLLEYQDMFTLSESKKVSGYAMVYKPITELFTIERGSGKYTKAYTQKHSGEYPVYSGNTFGEFARIDSYDYDTPCLTWAIDGLAGYMMAHKTPFSATNHRGVLIPKTKDIDLDYIKFALEPILRQAKKGRVGDNGENEYTSLPPFMLRDIEIGIPVDETGAISIEIQREIAAVYLSMEQYRREIASKLDALLKQRIEY